MAGAISLSPALFNPALYRNILKLWFKDVPHPTSKVPPQTTARWFGAGPEGRLSFDAQCSSTARDALLSVGPDQIRLNTGRPTEPSMLDEITAPLISQVEDSVDPSAEETALALILLFDQFTRNIFRDNQKLIYSHYDPIARSVLRGVLARGLDSSERYKDSPPWALWFYLPLMHSEDLQDHRKNLSILSIIQRNMEAKGDADAMEYVQTSSEFEKRHSRILEQFGRYPHRNQVLGRETTAEEKAYLENGGDTFGT